MYRKDQIKGIIALTLFGIIGISFLIFPDSEIPEYVSIVCFGLWLIVMFWMNKKFKNEKKEQE